MKQKHGDQNQASEICSWAEQGEPYAPQQAVYYINCGFLSN